MSFLEIRYKGRDVERNRVLDLSGQPEGNKEVPDVIHVQLALGVTPLLVLTEEDFEAVPCHDPCVEQLLVAFHLSSISVFECSRNIMSGAKFSKLITRFLTPDDCPHGIN